MAQYTAHKELSGDFDSLFHLISDNSNTKSQLELPVPSYGSRFHPQLKMWECVSVVDWFRRTYKSLLINLLESCSQVWGEKADVVRRRNSILDMPICACRLGKTGPKSPWEIGIP